MDLQKAVDFESFYFHSLLEMIRKNGNQKLPSSVHDSLNSFVDFLASGTTPLDSIEKLARLQGTSDLSIFFSDLVERITENPPESTIEKISDNANDFLEIFNELAKEPAWEKLVTHTLIQGHPVEEMAIDEDIQPVTVAPPTLPGRDLNITEFIHTRVSEKLTEFMMERDPLSLDMVNSLFTRLENDFSMRFLRDDFPDNESLLTVIELLEIIYQPPVIYKQLEDYFHNFWSNIQILTSELFTLSQEKFEEFEALCTGVVGVPETVSGRATEIDKIIENVQEHGEKEELRIDLSDEDRNLRWLLKDYIVNEIKELTREVENHMARLIEKPGDKQSQAVVLDNLKVLKDLGQIHKYPQIEAVNTEIFGHLKSFFQEQHPLPPVAGNLIKDLFGSYITYIDGVLSENEQPEITLLTQRKNDFLSIIKKTATPEISLSPKEPGDLQPVFIEVNSRFIRRIHRSLDEFKQHPQETPVKDQLLSDLNHLNLWYKYWKLSGGQNVLEILQNWLKNPAQHGKLIAKYDKVREILQDLSARIFSAAPEDWTGYVEKLTLAGKGSDGVDVKKSLKAFIDVTTRQMNEIKVVLNNPEIGIDSICREWIAPRFDQIRQNCVILIQPELQNICQKVLDNLSVPPAVGDDQVTEFRGKFDGFLDQLITAVKNLPRKIKLDNLMNQLDDLLAPLKPIHESVGAEISVEVEAFPEEPAGEPEVSAEQEMENTFRKEISRNLDEMLVILKDLDADIYDDKALQSMGNMLHSVNGAAQMMNRAQMAKLTGSMENLIELISGKKVELRKQYVTLLRKGLKANQKLHDDKKVDSLKIVKSIDDYIEKHRSPEESEDLAKKKSPPAKPVKKTRKRKKSGAKTVPESEKIETVPETPTVEPLLKLSEQDAELLDIFREETGDNLNNIEEHLNLIEKFKYDRQTVQSLDHAVHEIRSAAKMLGFSEIARLFDELEKLLEIAGKQGESDWPAVIPVFRKTVQVVRELTGKQQVSQQLYDDVSESLSSFVSSFGMRPVPQSTEDLPPAAPEPKDAIFTPDPMLKSYVQEARVFIEELNFVLMKLEKDPENKSLTDQLMRSLHTLKGSSSMMYQEELVNILHSSEELVERLAVKKGGFPPETCDLMFQVVDEMDYMLNNLDLKGRVKLKNYENLLTDLAEAVKKIPREETPVTERAPKKQILDSEKEYLSIADDVEVPEELPGDADIRLKVGQMDKLLNEAAELVINNNQFKNQLDRFKSYVPRLDVEGKNLQNVLWQLDKIVKEQDRLLVSLKPGLLNMSTVHDAQLDHNENIQGIMEHLQKFQTNFSQALQGIKESGKLYEEQLQKITRLSNQIHEEIIQARLVPVGVLFQRFQRPLRDLAKKYGKKIQLYLEGESTELDRILADELYEPLLHILRNAIDHGIEPVEERKDANKPEEGLIKIMATHERNYVIIAVEDDGRGIDLDQIRDRILEMDLLKKSEIQKLTQQDLYEFLMFPGFSTARVTSTLSGRGVGLDVVRNNIQKIKGDLRIYSQPGRFTRMSIRVPISITVTQAMLVDINQNTYALPLLQVEETTYVNQENLKLKDGSYFIALREGEIPVIHMSHLLNLPDSVSQPISRLSRLPVIVVQDEGKRTALLVDKIMHREEILIKSMGSMLQRTRYIMGGTILADGRVVLVLDIAQVVFSTLRLKLKDLRLQPADFKPADERRVKTRETPRKSEIGRRKITGRKPNILVVDDSLSVRKFLSGMLNKNHYEVELAKNGQMAIDLLNQKEFDAVITDLEMPQLSGYALIEQIRSESRWEELPIIVLTGRASKHVEQQSTRLGANEFVIKPFKESELLERLKKYIDYRK